MNQTKDWRALLQSLNEALDAGTAVKNLCFKTFHAIVGDVKEQCPEEEIVERYKCAQALRDRIVEAFPAERDSESIALLLSRVAARAGDPDAALALLKTSKKAKVRNYIPILRAYACAGAVEKSECMYASYLTPLQAHEAPVAEDSIDQRSLWEDVFATRVAAWCRAVRNEVGSDQTAQTTRTEQLQRILHDVVGFLDWITKGSALDNGFREAFGLLNWNVAEASPDDDGRCQASGVQLRKALNEDELDKVASDIDDLVNADIEKLRQGKRPPLRDEPLTKEEVDEIAENWVRFKSKVDELKDTYQVVVDGANVGQQMQNWDSGSFQHRAIETVLDAHERAGRRAVVVLRSRWRFNESCQLSKDMPQESMSNKRLRGVRGAQASLSSSQPTEPKADGAAKTTSEPQASLPSSQATEPKATGAESGVCMDIDASSLPQVSLPSSQTAEPKVNGVEKTTSEPQASSPSSQATELKAAGAESNVCMDIDASSSPQASLPSSQTTEPKVNGAESSSSAPQATGAESSVCREDQRTETHLAKSWRERGRIIVAPRGINDDNAAMLLAVTMSRRGVPDVQFVTNDFLRDHKRRADFSFPLRLWLDRHLSRYTLKYVRPDDCERYFREEAESDAANGAEPVPEHLVTPGDLEGPNMLQKVRLFPPLRYIAPAQCNRSGLAWHIPLGSDWICPRPSSSAAGTSPEQKGKAKRANAQKTGADSNAESLPPTDSVKEAKQRYERTHPTYLVVWAPSSEQQS